MGAPLKEKHMKNNKYSIYYDHIGYSLIEWEIPEDIPLDPSLGLENYEAIEWGIEHGIFDLIPINGYNEDGEPLDEDGETFDDRCLEASIWSDKYPEYMIPFYEFDILPAGHGAYVRKLSELVKSKPAIRES